MYIKPPNNETVVVALGANLVSRVGVPQQTVRHAIQTIGALPSVQPVCQSQLYGSAAVGPAGQDDYINAVLMLKTNLSPLQLLDTLLRVETDYGRIRDGTRWGPRVLDLDMIAYGNRSIHHERLQVPHPHAYHRCFVLAPLAEIAPQLVLPGYGKVSDLLKQCDTGDVYPLSRTQQSQDV